MKNSNVLLKRETRIERQRNKDVVLKMDNRLLICSCSICLDNCIKQVSSELINIFTFKTGTKALSHLLIVFQFFIPNLDSTYSNIPYQKLEYKQSTA